MKKILLSVVLIWLAVFHLSAQKKTQEKPSGASLLWEISGKGLKQPSFLFGTYHAVGKSFLDTLPGVKQQLDKAKVIVGEVIMGDEMAMMQKMMPFMLLQGNTLDKLLSSAEYAEVDALVKEKMGVGLQQLNQLKPIAVQMTLVMMLVPKDVTPENPPLDMYFQKEAQIGGKQVNSFETVEEQAAMLFNIPLERQKELLLITVREKDRLIRESANLFKHYKQQDLKAMEQDFKESKDFDPQEMAVLLTNRNKAWMSKLPAMLSGGPAFIAVGAGHLFGEQGLLRLLAQEGYTLKALSLK